MKKTLEVPAVYPTVSGTLLTKVGNDVASFTPQKDERTTTFAGIMSKAPRSSSGIDVPLVTTIPPNPIKLLAIATTIIITTLLLPAKKSSPCQMITLWYVTSFTKPFKSSIIRFNEIETNAFPTCVETPT